jgi:hypothetical protein
MTEPRSPGWYPDPEAPATLQRYYDGSGWTDDSRPTGYVTQPGGPAPVTPPPPGDTTPVFGATPPPSGDPEGPKRRMTTAVVAVAVAVALAALAGVLVLLGVL